MTAPLAPLLWRFFYAEPLTILTDFFSGRPVTTRELVLPAPDPGPCAR